MRENDKRANRLVTDPVAFEHAVAIAASGKGYRAVVHRWLAVKALAKLNERIDRTCGARRSQVPADHARR